MATLEEFLASGRLGDVTPGSSPEQIRSLLGSPADVSLSRKPPIWKYGALQLAFHTLEKGASPVLDFIGVYYREPSEVLPSELNLSGWWPTSETSVDDFKTRIDSSPTLAGRVTVVGDESIRFPSGAAAYFQERKLDSIQFAAPRQPTQKQVSLLLPLEVWAVVEQEAKHRQTSASKVCSDWISQEARRVHPAQASA